MEQMFSNINMFFQEIYSNFTAFINYVVNLIIENDNYKTILTGLGNTLLLAFFATLMGAAIGIAVAIIKYFCANHKNSWVRFIDKICNAYITIIRGTPVMVQLLLLATVVFANFDNLFIIAIIGFGLNSGAYVAEIVRAGINAVDIGQTEAGRSFGINKLKTMQYIIMPQAIKNILPALGNEFIVLLKETSVAGYIAVAELTAAGNLIKNNSYDANIYIIVAIVYLIVVMLMTKVLRIFERRMAKSDRGH